MLSSHHLGILSVVPFALAACSGSGGGGDLGSAGNGTQVVAHDPQPPGAAPPATSTPGDDDDDDRLAGIYSVPVSAELAGAAAFGVEGVRWKVQGENATLDYVLPRELTGGRERVKLTGAFDAAKNAYILAGEAGTGECKVTAARLDCTEHLTGITVDAAEALALTPENVDPAQRADVIAKFAVDPVGILVVDQVKTKK